MTKAPNRFIYVSSGSLPDQCYRDLGSLHFDEPYADAAVDPDGSAAQKRLQTLALAQYPKDADAVINVHSQQNEMGTQVTVTGDAIMLESHDTVNCELRAAPGMIDNSAKVAAGGIVGTLFGGLVTDRTEGAMGGAATGASLEAGSIINEKIQLDASRQTAIYDKLVEQKKTINDLLTERARLNECQEQEVSLQDCKINVAAADDKGTANADNGGADSNPNASASNFDLEKQIEEQQDYIQQLHQQVSDLRRQMGGY